MEDSPKLRQCRTVSSQQAAYQRFYPGNLGKPRRLEPDWLKLSSLTLGAKK